MDVPADSPPAAVQSLVDEAWLAYLYEHREWQPLISASRRALYEDPEHELAPLLLATAYAHVGRDSEASALFDGLLGSPLRGDVLLQRAFCVANEEPYLALVWLEKHGAEFPESLARDWRVGAQSRLLLSIGDLDGARGLTPDHIPSRVRRRHPWLGAATSAMVPGLGQLIAGQPVEAASAFAVVGLLGAGTAYAVAENRPGTAVIVGSIGGLFWAGNVYGGADAAVRWNRNQVGQIRERMDAVGVPGADPPPFEWR